MSVVGVGVVVHDSWLCQLLLLFMTVVCVLTQVLQSLIWNLVSFIVSRCAIKYARTSNGT